MEKVKMDGMVGLTKLFRTETNELSKGAVVIFAGSAAVCAPFAELLGYAVCDKEFALFFTVGKREGLPGAALERGDWV